MVLVSIRGSFREKINPPQTTPKRDLTNHPIYSKYQFNNTENTINIGIQPLWTPTGFITEALKRDDVLLNALSELGKKIQFFSFLKSDDVNFFLTRKVTPLENIDLQLGLLRYPKESKIKSLKSPFRPLVEKLNEKIFKPL